jgi:hypothetical protein
MRLNLGHSAGSLVAHFCKGLEMTLQVNQLSLGNQPFKGVSKWFIYKG